MRRTAIFLRHGKTEKHAEGQHDIDRLLATVGLEQAAQRREKLDNPVYDVVLSSPAGRAVDTAVAIAGVNSGDVVKIPALYPDPAADAIGAELDKYFNKIGYAPVSAYLAHGAGIVLVHGRKAWNELKPAIFSTTATSFLIVGHAVVLPAIGMIAARDTQEIVDELNALSLSECQGFTLVFEDQDVVDMIQHND